MKERFPRSLVFDFLDADLAEQDSASVVAPDLPFDTGVWHYRDPNESGNGIKAAVYEKFEGPITVQHALVRQ